ncbi:MAG: DNA polymerase III subunit delta [Myxococcales bacterium]|nr:DNA polymerase III subunit delta [Myxococcales bacterium]MBK7198769.1 DNA polymerase III subunit delta [Myxococcales bacterium]
MSDLVTAAAAGKLDPIYLVASEHPILVERALHAVRDAAVPASMRAWNYDVIEGKPTGARIVSACQTLPMMGARRMVFVRDLAPMVADELAAMIPYLDAPSPSTVLFMVTSKLDKRLKFYATAAKRGVIHELVAPKRIDGWIRAEADRRGVRLAADAVDRLAGAIGGDLSRLALTIDQLALYAGGRPVSADDVDDLVADTRERSVFELTDAIGAGDPTAALLAVDSLTEQRQSAIGVLAMLARHLRQLELCHVARAEGVGPRELPARLGVPPFVVDKLTSQARRYRPAALARAIELVAAADWALKGHPDPRLVGVFTDGAATGAAQKTLGRGLGERVLLERLAVELVALAG